MRGFAISFLTLARIASFSLLAFLCSMHPSWHRDTILLSHFAQFANIYALSVGGATSKSLLF
jgi:hypothetical protein